jgi:hypothetical protein
MWLPLVHGIVPHNHGESAHAQHHHEHTHSHSIQDSPIHTDGENMAWSSMHGALSHEDKKILLAVFALFAMWALVFSYIPPVALILCRQKIKKLLRRLVWMHASDIHRGRWLIRGISASRRFV